MKYFTPELFIRLQECPDATSFRAVNAAWEQAVQQYGAQLQQLSPRLSGGLRRFVRWGSLHDARLLEIGTTQRRTTVVLLEDAAPRLVSLTYSLVDAPTINQSALPEQHQATPTLWLYDEIDCDTEMLYNPRLRVQDSASAHAPQAAGADEWKPIFLHSILLSNGWEVRLRFHRLIATRTTSLLRPDERARQPEGSLSPTA